MCIRDRGVTVAIGRYIGENDGESAAKSMGASISIFAVFGVILTIIMVFVTPVLVSAMNVPAEAHDFAVQYLSLIHILNIIFSIAYTQSPCPMLIVKKYTFSAPASLSIFAHLRIVLPAV